LIRNILTSLALTTIAFTSFCQENEYKSAKDYALEGGTFYADEQYEQAFEAFRKVNYNDTAYFDLTLAALEAASKTDMVDSILIITTNVLEDDRYNPLKEKFVIMKGYGLLQQEKNEETLAFYDSYASEFPRSSVIQYNRSVALYNLKRYDEAIEALQTSIRFNPRYAAAHIKLGLICAEAEDYTKAALCMNMALFHSAAEDNALMLIATLENIYAMDMDESIGAVNYREDEDFDEIDLLIKNKVAESKKYKIGFKFPYNVFKYNHLVFSQIEYDESSNGFWNQNYVRFFQEIMEEDLFDYFSYYQCVRVENPKVQKTISKNMSRIKSSLSETADFFAKFMNERMVWDGTEYVKNDLIHYGAYGFNAKVKTNADGKQVGPYLAFTDDGLVEAEGTLDSDGKQDGLWTFYDEDGRLSIKTVFKAGELDGTRSTYYENGSLSQRFDVKESSIDGKLELFTAFNQLYKEVPYEEGKENGTLKSYYNTGELYLTQEYKEGVLDGPSLQYFASGEEKAKETYVDGKLDGEYVELYRNGTFRTKGQYEEGEPVGHWEYYYDNGQLREQGDFKNGLRIGLWKRFSKNGKLSEETNYGETGKKIGVYKEYDLDEKLILELTYKGEEIIEYKTYDENGKILGQGEKKRRELEFENYWSNGQLRAKGNYYKGNRVGTWKFYNQYGVLTSEEPHNEEGELHGEALNYFDNGQLETSIMYKDGERHGLLKDYFRNGTLYKTGYMYEGQSVGEWRFYYKDGTLNSTAFFQDGERMGEAVFYDEKGRLDEILTWYRGVLQSIEQFDTNGVSLYKMELKDGKNPDVHFVNSVGKVVQDRAYDGAQVNGNSVFYYGSGKVRAKGLEVDGDNHGEWEWFHENGKIETRGSYEYGTRIGKWVWYFEDGQVDVELTYDDGNIEGERLSYYRDGTLESKTYYRNDELHGKCTYYDEAGEVLIIRYYKDGRMLGYSYLGKDGNEVDMIPFDNQNGLIETFYKNGNTAYRVEYKDGYKHGKSVEYHSNGKEAITRQFEKGQLVGERKQYYPSGKLKNVGTYYYGDRHDTRTSYYENGKVKSIENYIMGTLYGRAIYYKPDGTIEREVQYYDDSQIND